MTMLIKAEHLHLNTAKVQQSYSDLENTSLHINDIFTWFAFNMIAALGM